MLGCSNCLLSGHRGKRADNDDGRTSLGMNQTACVLIVEDDDDVREFMQLLVASCGYETMTARDGEEALVRMRQRRPCLVLLDLQMPRMDGWEFRERQLQDLSLRHIPVVCVTAFFDPDQVTRKLGLRCIPKPADFPAIINAVESTCGGPPC
jgi:two-component system, chemotaxis family, chemotaxis protein CheY